MTSKNKKFDFKFPTETMLELVQLDDSSIVLRSIQADDDNLEDNRADDSQSLETPEQPLVRIEFSDKIQELLGDDLKHIGQHMIHSAIQMLMQQQVSSWHANVVDEEPTHYS